MFVNTLLAGNVQARHIFFYLNISGVSFQVHVKVSLKGERMHRYKEKIGGEKKENLLSLLAQKIISPWNWKKNMFKNVS